MSISPCTKLLSSGPMLKLVEWYAQTASALLAAKQKADPRGWQDFQEAVHALKNQRTRALREAEDLQASIFAADTALRLQKEGAIGEPLLCMGHLVCVSPSLLCAACCRALYCHSSMQESGLIVQLFSAMQMKMMAKQCAADCKD